MKLTLHQDEFERCGLRCVAILRLLVYDLSEALADESRLENSRTRFNDL